MHHYSEIQTIIRTELRKMEPKNYLIADFDVTDVGHLRINSMESVNYFLSVISSSKFFTEVQHDALHLYLYTFIVIERPKKKGRRIELTYLQLAI